jgi:hypothetical protein
MKLSMFLMCFDIMGISHDIRVLWTPKQTLTHNVIWNLGHVQMAFELKTFHVQNIHFLWNSKLQWKHTYAPNSKLPPYYILVYIWTIITHNSNNNHTLISWMQLVILVHSNGCKWDTLNQ